MPRNTDNGVLCFVNISLGGTPVKYGFISRVKSTARSALGQTVITSGMVDASFLQGFILGCNSPKPPRATKRFTTGYESSFISAGSIAAARADGWRITRGRVSRLGGSSDLSETRYVTINGMKYAFQYTLPSTDVAAPDVAPLGLKKPTSADTDLIWGCTFPKPPTLRKVLDDGTSLFSTFCDPTSVDTGLAAKWAVSKPGNYTLDALKAITG